MTDTRVDNMRDERIDVNPFIPESQPQTLDPSTHLPPLSLVCHMSGELSDYMCDQGSHKKLVFNWCSTKKSTT